MNYIDRSVPGDAKSIVADSGCCKSGNDRPHEGMSNKDEKSKSDLKSGDIVHISSGSSIVKKVTELEVPDVWSRRSRKNDLM